MISFLNSGILFLASAVIIPILIYLFARKKPHKIVFSSIRFIKQSQQQQKKRINLTNILLLLIRLLIILFIILAIARPALKSDHLKASGSHPKTALAIIIDNSYSMNYLVDTQTELDKAKAILHNINEMLNDDDISILLTSNEVWNELHSNPVYGRINADLINEIELSALSIGNDELLRLAETKLQEIHLPNREIILVTDLQKFELPRNIQFPAFIIPTSEQDTRANISCQNATLDHQIVDRQLERTISFDIVNHSSMPMQDIIFQLFINGNTIAEKITDLRPGQRKTEKFQIDLEEEGWYSGFVEVKNERQIFDNRSYFSFYHDPSLNTVVLTDLPELPSALQAILEIYAGRQGNVMIQSSLDFSLNQLLDIDNIILYQKSYSEKLAFFLSALKEAQRGVIYICDAGLSNSWKSFYENIFTISWSDYSQETSYSIDFFNPYHSVTNNLNTQRSTQIKGFWKVKTSSPVLMQTGSYPLVIQNENSLLWLFDLRQNNPFIIDHSFPVFAYNSFRFSARNTQITPALQIGEPIKAQKLILPDNREIEVANKRFLPLQTGIYSANGKQIAVNLDYQESEYRRLETIESDNPKILSPDSWQQNILHSRYGFEIWKYLLIAVLILFGLEMFLIKKEERKS
jgi:biopolymer transport protein ExbD